MNMQLASSDKTRVQIDLSPAQMLRLNWLMNVCDLTSRKDLFNNALSLLEWAAKESFEGRKIASFDDESSNRYILSMPALLAASAARSSIFDVQAKSELTEA